MALAKVVDAAPAGQEALYVKNEADGKFYLDVEGGFEDTSGLKSALQKERDAAKEAARKARELEDKFKDIDPDKVRDMMKKMDQDGEAALIAAGKFDEVLAKRTEKLRADLQRQIDEANGKAKSAEERVWQYSQRVLDDRIRDAVVGKVHVHAIKSNDVLRAAREIFTLDTNGDAVQLGADGKPVIGKDGKTPYSPSEWIEDMVAIAPHWFPSDSTGGGAGGSKDASSGGKTMKRAAFDALPARERAAASKQYQIVD